MTALTCISTRNLSDISNSQSVIHNLLRYGPCLNGCRCQGVYGSQSLTVFVSEAGETAYRSLVLALRV